MEALDKQSLSLRDDPRHSTIVKKTNAQNNTKKGGAPTAGGTLVDSNNRNTSQQVNLERQNRREARQQENASTSTKLSHTKKEQTNIMRFLVSQDAPELIRLSRLAIYAALLAILLTASISQVSLLSDNTRSL